METTTRNESSYEYFDSDHMNHENRLLRKVLKEKEEIIKDKNAENLKLKYENEFLKSVIKANEIKHQPPYGA